MVKQAEQNRCEYDVLIAGGGLVGVSLACALAPSGLRIGVIEAVPFRSAAQPSFDDRTIALAYGSRRILEGIAVWQQLDPDSAYPISGIHISDRGHFGFARLEAGDLGVEALGYVIETRALGAALLNRLQQCANIELICPATLKGVILEDDRARVDIDAESRVSTISARLLVAADGGQSAVRQLLGIVSGRRDYRQTAIVTNVEPTLGHANIAYERFTPSGPLAFLPMDPRRCAVVWSVHTAEVEPYLAWSDDKFLAQLQRYFGTRLGDLRHIGKRMHYPLLMTTVDEVVRPRLVLLGNAAHTVHPVAGQGFNLGLRDVATLSELVVDNMRVQRDIGDIGTLQHYQQSRRRDTRAVSAFTDVLIRVFANDIPPLVLARNLGLIAVDLFPGIKRTFMRRTSGLSGRLPRLARGLSL